MVAEPTILQKMRKISKKPPPKPPATSGGGATVGILSFELANAMSRAVRLHRSLSDGEISRLLTETLPSPSILSLVSPSRPFLLSLAALEKLDDLNRVASAASRLGRRHCSLPALVGFEHIYSDLLSGGGGGRGSNPSPISNLLLLLPPREMDSAVRKMERFVSSTAALYAELEVLSDLEHSAKKFPATDEVRRSFDDKIRWQRHDVAHIRRSSLWSQPFDKVVLLLARAVCTIHARILAVFGLVHHDPSPVSSFHREDLKFHCAANPGRILFSCLNLGGVSGSLDLESNDSDSSITPNDGVVKLGKFGPKSRLTSLAPASSVGGSCLALHYANVVIIIEKLLWYPHLVGDEARDDLYQMLPSSLRLGLRKSLKSYVKSLAIYDASLAHDWRVAMERILSWLAPMAHNMIRWQTERNIEQQQIVMKDSVLLLQTLYFADREKTESAICELLVGLNYICRYEQQQSALLDCSSSADFDDCMDWQQMQLDSAAERL